MVAGRLPPRVLTPVLAVAVFGIFGVLCVRHVGDSYFLGDQIDQLQNFEQLLRLEPHGLWGGWMSGTNPPARALGPLAAIVFGVPVRLGLGPDGAQWVTSVLLALSALAAFGALAAVDDVLAWTWFLLFSASGLVWWSAGILWSNAILLPLGCLLLAALVAYLRRPSVARMLIVLLVLLFALQAHLVVLAAVPAIAVVLACAWPQARHRPASRRVTVAAGVATLLALGPYILAELLTGFTNTQRMFAHLSEVRAQDAAPGRAAFRQVLRIASDPAGLLEALAVPERRRVTIAAVLAAAACAACVWLYARQGNEDRERPRVMMWLLVASIIGVIGQAAFFVLTNRSLLGFHYVEFLAPLYPIPVALLIAAVIGALPRAAGRAVAPLIGVACAAVLLVRGPAWADRSWERTDWTYRHIVAAITALCADAGAVKTAEGPEFASPTPGYDPVVRYLLTRRFVQCRYDRSSEAMLVAQMNTAYLPVRTEPDGEYRLVSVASPGLALYMRTPGSAE
jgi:hypothetical protein